ncbi:MAG: hypothetical protein U5K51_16500 [Flavobacteriaceae bacterium]|nr:hypothetical protein [Flavobacteriaceae bacterium]
MQETGNRSDTIMQLNSYMPAKERRRVSENEHEETNLRAAYFIFSYWLPENFSDADSYRQGNGGQPESEATLGCGG